MLIFILPNRFVSFLPSASQDGGGASQDASQTLASVIGGGRAPGRGRGRGRAGGGRRGRELASWLGL